MTPKILDASEGEICSGVGGAVRFLLSAEESRGALGMVMQEVPPGSGPPLHHHEDSDEALYVVSGNFEFTLDREIRRLAAGGFLFIPRGVRHRFVNLGPGTSSLLVISAPGGFEEYFRERVNINPATDAAAIAELGSRFRMVVDAPEA